MTNLFIYTVSTLMRYASFELRRFEKFNAFKYSHFANSVNTNYWDVRSHSNIHVPIWGQCWNVVQLINAYSLWLIRVPEILIHSSALICHFDTRVGAKSKVRIVSITSRILPESPCVFRMLGMYVCIIHCSMYACVHMLGVGTQSCWWLEIEQILVEHK